MTQQIINIGSAINDGTGDPARTAFDKSNQNFTELYAGVAANVPTGNTIEYQFNNATTEPPVSGQIRFNQAVQASTTKIWASQTTASGINIKQFLSAATTGAKLIIQDKNDNTNYIKLDVTGAPVDKTTYWEFAVAVTASGGTLPNAAILAAVTAPSGGGGNVSNSGTPLVGQVALWTDATHIKGVSSVTEQTTARSNIYAAPFDALAYSGLQINGSMEVSQENGATAVSTTLKYVVDGFIFDIALVSYTGSAAQVADAPPGFTSSIKITIATTTGAADNCRFLHRIEGYRFSRLAWGTPNAQPLSIGFWCKIHRTGMYSVGIRNGGNTRSYVFTFTQNVADTWEYKTATVPGDTTGTWPTDNTSAVSLSFCMAALSASQTTPNVWAAGSFIAATGTTIGAAATTDTFQIAGIVVLPGIELPSAARSPLIMRPYDQELLTCKRYYQQLAATMRYFATVASQNNSVQITFPEMRAAPTVSLVTVGTGSATLFDFTLAAASSGGTLNMVNSGAAGDTYCFGRVWTLDARL